MHYILPGQQTFQFFSIELKNIHPESPNDDLVANLSQLCQLLGFRRDQYDLGKAEIVVASLGDFIGLMEQPVVIKGR